MTAIVWFTKSKIFTSALLQRMFTIPALGDGAQLFSRIFVSERPSEAEFPSIPELLTLELSCDGSVFMFPKTASWGLSVTGVWLYSTTNTILAQNKNH